MVSCFAKIIFTLTLSAFPLTTSFLAKNNIAKFFVEDHAVYLIIKLSGLCFTLFAVKLITPIFYSVSLFELDKKGKNVSLILYTVAFALLLQNIVFFSITDLKLDFFYLFSNFFIFIAYVIISIVFIFIINFLAKSINFKVLLQRYFYTTWKSKKILKKSVRNTINFLSKSLQDLVPNKKLLDSVLKKSKITPSVSILFVIIFIILLLIKA